MLAKPLDRAILTQLLVNTGLVACAIAVGATVAIEVWHHEFLWAGASYFVAGTGAIER